MAGEAGAPGDPLEPSLVRRARTTTFFQMVRLLERLAPHAARVGDQGPASEEAIRFRPDVSLAFPATDIADLAFVDVPGRGDRRVRVTATFMGLYGSTSPLPSFYAEDLLSGDDELERVRAFLDIFHHRLLSLLYRCWSKYRHDIQFEYGERDRITPRLFSLIGLATPALREAVGLPDPERLLHFGGLLGRQQRPASALEGLLTDYFDGLPVEVEQCVGRWTEIPAYQQMRLGQSGCRLGADCVIGRRVFARACGVRLWLGPLDEQRFQAFLPGQDDPRVLAKLVSFYTNDAFEFDLGLRVRSPSPVLLGSGPNPSRLGWNTWLAHGDEPEPRERRVVLGEASYRQWPRPCAAT